MPTIAASYWSWFLWAFFYSFLYGYGPSYVLSVVLITFFLAIGFMSNNNIRDIDLSDEYIKAIEEAHESVVYLKLKIFQVRLKLLFM